MRLKVLVLSLLLMAVGCGDDPVTPTLVTPPPVITGSIIVEITPSTVDAQWELSGPDEYGHHGSGDETLTELVPGEYEVSYGYFPGYDTPDNESQILSASGECVFSGLYNLVPSFIDQMIVVDADRFSMGSPRSELGHQENETAHDVILTNSFHMAVSEVTNQQYSDLAQWAFDNGYCSVSRSSLVDNLDEATEELLDLDSEDSEVSFNQGIFSVDSGKENYPVKEVSWYGAVSYCDWLSIQEGISRAYDHSTWQCNNNDPYQAQGYRLPTEAEWEFACRAGATTAFTNGEITEINCEDPILDSAGWYCGNADVEDHPVAELSANRWELYDMHGNLYEWCNDWYDVYDGDITDPSGADLGELRIIRGGGWSSSAVDCRSAYRFYSYPYGSSDQIGFRFVRTLQ
jgi:formylglycine-generating enzyme required for sulfatase activity